MIFEFMNSGIEEEVLIPNEKISNIYLPLLKMLTHMQIEKNRRILVLLAAPPGAGKSTLVSLLQHLSETTEGVKRIVTLGMDGFHHYQDYLKDHYIVRDGKEINMVDVKGAPETFDLELLEDRIRQVMTKPTCGWPVYDRLLHNPVDPAVTVDGDIVIIEGNYLLLDFDGWKHLKEYADYTIKITEDENVLRERLIRRKISTGVDEERATEFVDFSDMYNVRLCLTHSMDADLEI